MKAYVWLLYRLQLLSRQSLGVHTYFCSCLIGAFRVDERFTRKHLHGSVVVSTAESDSTGTTIPKVSLKQSLSSREFASSMSSTGPSPEFSSHQERLPRMHLLARGRFQAVEHAQDEKWREGLVCNAYDGDQGGWCIFRAARVLFRYEES
jgi:hypothetical protein